MTEHSCKQTRPFQFFLGQFAFLASDNYEQIFCLTGSTKFAQLHMNLWPCKINNNHFIFAKCPAKAMDERCCFGGCWKGCNRSLCNDPGRFEALNDHEIQSVRAASISSMTVAWWHWVLISNFFIILHIKVGYPTF